MTAGNLPGKKDMERTVYRKPSWLKKAEYSWEKNEKLYIRKISMYIKSSRMVR